MQTVQKTSTTSESSTEKYLVCQIGNESYGIPLLQVQEIRTYTPATRVPGAPPYVLGVINLRGNIIAVLDARTRFGIEPVAEEGSTVIIVVQIEGKTFGLRVDSVSDVVDIDTAAIQPPPAIASEQTQRFLNGLVQVGERVLLLNLPEIFDMNEISRWTSAA